MDELEKIKDLVMEEFSLGRISEQTANEIIRLARQGMERLLNE